MKCISIFKCNPQIEVIDKSHCSLEDVPNFQNYSRSLEELYLDANKLILLNDNVFRLTKLRRFSISDNAIQDIPPDIAKLVNLVELDCSRNKIQHVPEQIKFLRGLQVCDFSANLIEYLPSGLMQLKNLTCLSLNFCQIKSLPDDIGLLKNLESLELRENEFEALPASITSLERLKKLDVGRNYIKQLPPDIGKLTQLEYLLADSNYIESVPSKIGRLEKLQCLDLSRQDTGLKSLPEEIGGLSSLTDLFLSENHLRSLPDGIRSLKHLSILKADCNYLSELNPAIGGCTALQELVLTSNQISTLPSTIGNLTDLRSLYLDSNLLNELVPQIGNLKRLGILSIRDNFLRYLPTEIGQLEFIKVLDLSGNLLEYLPVSITALNLKALWLSKNQSQPLLKLQIEEISGAKVLTCYLLPQQGDDVDYSEQARTSIAESDNYDPNRPAAVTFDTAAIEDIELSHDANFVRHNTPHPKELKLRHQKIFGDSSGNTNELKGHDNASFSLADNPIQAPVNRGYEYSHESQAPHRIDYESNGLPEIVPNLAYPEAKIKSNGNNHENERIQEDGDYPGQRLSFKEALRSFRRAEQILESPVANDQCHVFDIVVRRLKNHKPGLGLSIAGGKDTPPYKDNDEGIFVSKVTRGGPAEAAGVKVGDKILVVNNNTFYEGITHQKAVDIFKRVKPDCVEFTMRVLRDPNDAYLEHERQDDEYSIQGDNVVPLQISKTSEPRATSNTSTFTRTYTIPVKTETNGTVNNIRQFLMKEPEKANNKPTSATLPPGMGLLDAPMNKNIIYTTLVKDYKHDLGIVLENRADENDHRSSWSNIVISAIKPNSIAARDGKLEVDDRLLSINGADVTGIDLDRIMLMLEGTERFIRIVVSRGDDDNPIGAALRDMPVRPSLGSWFSSTSNMSHRPSLIESYQRPTFGSVSSLQKQPTPLIGTKPPKPPKPSHLIPKEQDLLSSANNSSLFEDNPIARPRGNRGSFGSSTEGGVSAVPQTIDAEKRAAWRRERLKSIEDDVEMAKLIAEAQRRRREEL